MKYRVRVWCRDCSGGQDPKGCFDGGDGFIYERTPPYGPRLFDSVEEADDAGYCGPWEYEVETENGDDVESGSSKEDVKP